MRFGGRADWCGCVQRRLSPTLQLCASSPLPHTLTHTSPYFPHHPLSLPETMRSQVLAVILPRDTITPGSAGPGCGDARMRCMIRPGGDQCLKCHHQHPHTGPVQTTPKPPSTDTLNQDHGQITCGCLPQWACGPAVLPTDNGPGGHWVRGPSIHIPASCSNNTPSHSGQPEK